MATLSPGGAGDAKALRTRARRGGIEVGDDDDWSDMFSKILTLRVEPRLGMGRACVLYEYPVCEAALARVSPRDPRVAERFELYACGVELANGFGELTDADAQRARFERDMAKKEKVYGVRFPLDEDFLAALATMPPASGVALGFDRLVMLVTGAPNIDAVLWTPML
jgi:lysyl-tRNA synthetase class 2